MTNARLKSRLMDSRPVAVDLFSGVGGMSLGLELAGFFSAVHVEVEAETSRYAEYNFPLAAHLAGEKGDVRSLSGSRLRDLVDGREISVIAGGPPCQGFSRAGRRRVDDPLNDLVLEMARIVMEVRPQAFVIENVPGSLSDQYWQFGKAVEILEDQYSVSPPTTLRAEEFGVPQIRRRVFTVGIRRDLGTKPFLPVPTHVSPTEDLDPLFGVVCPVVGDAIMDLPDPDDYDHLFDADSVEYTSDPKSAYATQMRLVGGLAAQRGYAVDWDERICTNLRRTHHGPDLTARLTRLEQGRTDPSSRIPRLSLTGLSPTIRAGTTSDRGSWSAPRPCHPVFPRVITTREAARLQSFPDWFRFHPVKWHGNRQVGNAVPPLLARAVGTALIEALSLNSETGLLGTARRDEELIGSDLAAASTAGYGQRRPSHKVVNTGAAARKSS